MLLQELELFDGIVILTTNKLEAFDEAFMRRINFKIKFGRPDKSTRFEIWKKQIPEKIDISKDVDFNYLSEKYELSGAEIKNSIFRAASIAVCDNSKKLEMKHFIQAIEEETGNEFNDRKLMGFV